ncbi:DNA repair-scaffolding protein [Rana temporaria]|uniref:DNA repair-scaffolding protein n=1 Tax=Rana temporaria TaxID=8407 RepID=UPI001AAD2EFE|nr:DNA repair-scaffolding protein [Rana temporaria]
MPQGKRKRATDKIHACFPDDASTSTNKSTGEGVMKPSSLNKAWMKCGEGFHKCPGEKQSKPSGRKSQVVRHLAQSFFLSEETSADDCTKDPADIVWSSSDSNLSNDEGEETDSLLDIAELSPQSARRMQVTDMPVSLEGCSGVAADGITITDFQDDSELECSDKCYASENAESVVEISDSESSTSDLFTSQQCEPKLSKALSILEYVSDEPEDECSVPSERQNVPVCEENTSGGRTVSEWVKTAQVLLQTPRKKMDKAFKTPEDSAKKKKRFVRGGLAERLNRLQNRERSAITFWRHQSGSDCRIPMGDKSDTLLLKLIDIHEECAVWIAACQTLTDQQTIDNPVINHHTDATKLKVLFSRQTIEQLKPKLNDIIHIYPPWQKLFLYDEDMSIIINTYHSQKIIANQNEDTEDKTYCSTSPVKKRLVPLSVVFQLDNGNSSCHVECQSRQQVSVASALQSLLCNPENSLCARSRTNNSLLDLVETQGASGWKGVCICVVQRVYCLTSRDSPRHLHQECMKKILDATAMPQKPNFSLCLLIQDTYGIFSELQVQLTDTATEDIEKYCQMLEGKSCCFSGLKILQRTTRGRAPGLFSLIDSLWPPLAPIKIHGQSQEQGQISCALPSPSFCYVLALRYEEGSESIKPGDIVSDLYLPPVIHSLDEILQVVVLSQRCSFWATVIYVRPEIQGDLPMKKEFWIYVTDATLQMTPETSGIPKILSVCVLPSCAVDTRVLEALANKLTYKMFFKDAVKENGKIICVERTVLSLQKPLLSQVSVINELTGPVILDKLDSATEANSLRIVTGIINGVDERESFSWPVCNLCGSSKLQPWDSDRHKYLCRQCAANISSPVIRMQLEVYLHCELTPDHIVRLKLQQNTISSILSSCSSEDGRYEVSAILGRQVGPVSCYVQHVSSSVALEEICLLQAGMPERQGGLDFAV